MSAGGAFVATNYIEIARGLGYREVVVAPQGRVTPTRRQAAARAFALGVAFVFVGSLGGCYSTTPHRAEIATPATANVCAAAVRRLFAESSYVQLPSPPHVSMFFAPRMRGPYTAFLEFGTGVGVTINADAAAAGTCRVTIEALSPDAGCGNNYGSPSMLSCQDARANPFVGPPPVAAGGQANVMPCPVTPPLACELSYAPGAENDAAVDELARRLQAALGPQARVN
jgi:hypothetical protein